MVSKGVLAALAYAITSIAITLFNKAVLSVYAFDYAITLTLLQAATSLVFLVVSKRAGIIQFPDFDMEIAKKVFPLSLIFVFYVVISLSALGAVNIPMFTALRRTTVVFVMIFEIILLNKHPSSAIKFSMAIMVLGAIIAAAKDITFDPVSYTLVFLTNLSTAIYVVMINRVKKDTNLNVFAILFYNNVLTSPLLFIIAVAVGEFDGLREFEHWTDFGFLFMLTSSMLLAFFLNLTTFFSTTLNSALTQTVVGQLKNFVAFLLGLVLFSDYVYDPVNMFGLLVGFGGGVMYGVVNLRENQAAASARRASQRSSDNGDKV